MRYFLDAEFNGFGGDLISLALAPEDGRLPFFYAAVECPAPTEWVAANVLPVLETDPLPREEVAQRFSDYLTDDEHPILIADWPEDIAHAANMLVTGPGRMSPIRTISFELVDPVLIGAVALSEVPHNAYHDACALRAAVLDYEKRMAPWPAAPSW